MQNAIGTALYTAWLGGLPLESSSPELGRLLTLQEIGTVFKGKPLSYPFQPGQQGTITDRLMTYSPH